MAARILHKIAQLAPAHNWGKISASVLNVARHTLFAGSCLILGTLILYSLTLQFAIHHYEGRKDAALELVANVLGVPVTAQSMELGWDVLSPWARLDQVQVRTRNGFPAITFGRLEFDIGFWTSLQAGRPTANQIRVYDADVQLVQGPDGRFGLAGGTGEAGIDLRPLVDFLRDAATAHIKSARIRVDSELPAFTNHFIDVRFDFENVFSADERALSASLTRLSGADVGESLSLAGNYDGELRDLEGLNGRFRLRAENLNSDDWRAPLTLLGGEWLLATTSFDGLLDMRGFDDFSLRINAHGAEGTFTAATSTAAKAKPLLMASPSIEIFARRSDGADWQWQVAAAAGEMAGLPLKAFQLTGDMAEHSKGSRSLTLALDQADTEYLRRFLLSTNLLTPLQTRWLVEIKPTANFSDFKLRLETTANRPPQFAASLRFEHASVKAFNAIPQLENLAGELLIFEQGGILQLSDRPFNLHFPYLFKPTIEVNRGSGEVAFFLVPDAFFVRGKGINIDTNYGFATGDFSVSNPKDPEFRVLSLHFGFDHIGRHDQTLQLLPTPLSKDLRGWLTGALRAVQFERGGAIYHDHLRQDAADLFDVSSLGLLWDLNEVDLKYSDNWPAVQTSEARVHVTEAGTEMYMATGQMFDMGLDDLYVRINNDTPMPKHSTIKATGRVNSALDQAMTFTRTTPLSELVGDEVLSWQINGATFMAADLDVQLDWTRGGEIVSEGTRVNLSGTITDASLHAPSIDLTFHNASGDLLINSDVGVFAENISFQTLGSQGDASIISDWQSSQNDVIAVKLSGAVGTSELANWLEMPALNIYKGAFDYQGEADFTFREATGDSDVKLVLKSDLRGVNFPMPEPFAKTKNEARAAVMTLTTTTSGSTSATTSGSAAAAGAEIINIAFKAEPGIGGLLELRDGSLDRGIVHVNDAADLVLPPPGSLLHVQGEIASSDLGGWVEYIDAIDLAYQHETGQTEGAPVIVTSVGVRTNVSVGDFVFHDSLVKIHRNESKALTDVTLTSRDGSGDFIIHDDDSLPIEANVYELKVATAANGEVLPEGMPEADLLAGVDFADLVPMQVSIESLLIDEQSYGSWGFTLNPSADKVVFTDVVADIRGYKLVNDEESTVVWTRGEGGDRTSYTGHSEGADLGDILENWEYPTTIDADHVKVTANASWPGSPAMFDWLIVSGYIEAELRRGELTTVDPSMVSLNKLIGLLDISSWVRRLYLDFDDLQSKGIGFDRLYGSFEIDQGVVIVDKPLRLLGPGSTLSYTGTVDIKEERLDGNMVATLPLTKSLSWGGVAYGAIAAQPIAGLAVWLLTRLFKDSFDQISSLNYTVSGSLLDPEIQFDKVFGNDDENQQNSKKDEPEDEVGQSSGA